jgi:acyl-CoA synthetase (AMP-forming)/AMP-acid ligase II/thiamine pyrophosphate-dependent acetolactate synthase large subunit-like protein
MPAEISPAQPPAEASSKAARPWLQWYGKVPTELSYPEGTLYDGVARTAQRVPDAVAWDFFDATASYREFLASIDTCANALAALGLRAGERIVVAMPTSPQAVIAFYAANKLGAVSAFVHPLSTAPEIEHFLDATGARIALTLDALYGHFASIRPRVPLETLILARVPDYLSPLKRLGFWFAKGRHIPKPRVDPRVRWWASLMCDPKPQAPRSPTTTYDPAAILFSGGTTGTPKGIVLSNRNFTAQALQVGTWAEVHEEDSILAILPIFHGFGLGVCVNLMFMTGGKSILVPTFTAKGAASLLRKKKPNLIVGVPTLYEALTHDKSLARTDLACLRGAFSGGDRLPRPVKRRFEALVERRGGSVTLQEGYGLTEAVTAVMAMPRGEYREGSVGVPFPDVLAKICSPDSVEELRPGSEGEICIAGPNVMIGYLDDPEATRRTLRRHGDGRMWLHTGDLGRMDAEGFFYFIDRFKRLIKSSGYNVFPAQVEAVLYTHPRVLEACIVGVPDAAQGERVKAFVVLKDQAQPGPDIEKELIALCQSQLIKWSCPREIEFRRLLPKTRIGKIDYKALVAANVAHGDAGEPVPHGGDRVAATLRAHDVRFLFTLCGGHISPILVSAKARGLRIVDVRDEATSVFAADAVARLTGGVGVAAVTAGPGVTNMLTALKNAQLAQSPVIVLGGGAPTALQGHGALQDIEQAPIVAPHVKLVKRVRRLRDLVPAMEEAFAAARDSVPGPAFVECPVDLLYEETSVRALYDAASGKGTSIPNRMLRFYLKRHVDRMFAEGGAIPPPRARKVVLPTAHGSCIAAAARRLAKAQRPLLVIGSQTLALADDPLRIAAAVSRLGIPVYLSGMARGLLGPNHPLQMHHQRRQALRESDCVILAGVPCDFRLDYGRQLRRSSALIAANRSRKDARLNRRPDIAALGDAGDFLERLAAVSLSAMARRKDWIEELHARDRGREAEIDEQAKVTGEHVNPIALLRAINQTASENALFVADGGDFVATASYVVRPRGPRGWLDPGVFGTLGVGAGFALGAALCRPDAEVWILYGDGACGWGLTEFDTFVRHGIPVIAIVGNDASWTQIAREQVKMLHDNVGTVLARTAYHEVAAAFGAEGILVKTTAEVPDALLRARAAAKAGKPVLVNVWLNHSDFREGSISM